MYSQVILLIQKNTFASTEPQAEFYIIFCVLFNESLFPFYFNLNYSLSSNSNVSQNGICLLALPSYLVAFLFYSWKKKLPSYSQPSILGPLTSLNPTLPSIASPIHPHLLSFPSYYLPVNTQPSSPVATSLPTSDCSHLQSTYPLFTIQNTSPDIFSTEIQPKFNVLPHTTALPSNTHSMQT